MEADWEFEVGGEAPVIEVRWPGFVDLRLHPERTAELAEAVELPALARALKTMNAPQSPVWTSKCDVWPIVRPAELDPDELDAPPESAAYATGCYIDILARTDRAWDLPAKAVDYCKNVCTVLRAVELRCCRLDLIIRSAIADETPLDASRTDLGITAYITTCGSSRENAADTLQAGLSAFARVLCGQSTLE